MTRLIAPTGPLPVHADDAPNSYEELTERFQECWQAAAFPWATGWLRNYPVSRDNSEKTVYGCAAANMEARLLHDCYHFWWEKDFSFEDEIFVAEQMVADFQAEHANVLGRSFRKDEVNFASHVLWGDTAGLLIWAKSAEMGKILPSSAPLFPEDQRAAVISSLFPTPDPAPWGVPVFRAGAA